MKYIDEKIYKTLEKLNDLITVSKTVLEDFRITPCGFKKDNVIPEVDDSWQLLTKYMSLTATDQHYWICGTVHTPKTSSEDEFITLDFVNPRVSPVAHTIIYLDGEMIQGLDANHTATELEPDRSYQVALYAYYGSLVPCEMMMPTLCVRSRRVEKLYFDMEVPYESSLCIDKASNDYKVILKHLEIASNYIDFRYPHTAEFYESVEAADAYLMEEFYGKACGREAPIVNCLGHSHMDIAWRWTVEQTREKAQRSFSSVIYLMKKYPEYLFMMTQPQLYTFLKEEAPEMYAQVKERIKEGRWEVDGAMWLEADGNLPSGESFIRQVLFGKRFFREEFGVDSKTLWIPDVFGYSAALPQILRKSGVERFVTGKISWNDSNRIPNDTFYWQGIDGTEIFTNFLTTKDFVNPDKTRDFVMINGVMSAEEVKSTFDIYRNKEFNDATMTTFGYGDGGGGPTKEMLEKQRRFAYGIPGMPRTEMSTLDRFLNKVKTNFDASCERLMRTPKWVGELYLEYHRGTYTSIAKNKRNNRQCEFLMQDTEMIRALTDYLRNLAYPKESLEYMWKLMLLNQFHDIIPGTSIKAVYDTTDMQYAEIRKTTAQLMEEGMQCLTEGLHTDGGYLVWNPNGFTANGVVEDQGVAAVAENVPAFGYAVLSDLYRENHAEIEHCRISNQYFDIRLAENGNLLSVYDKKAGKEIILQGKEANLLRAYEDMPRFYDAWELTHYYKQKYWDLDDVISIEPFRNGAKAGLRVKKQFMSSTLVQDIVVYDNIPRIDFETTIDWKEAHLILKALFPMNIKANKVTAEIQFGHVERPTHSNTSWDEAKFEMCMHKWVDLSDSGFGVSLLNDCKYGFSADENVVGLTLLKCATDPNPAGDKEIHHLTYSIYSHEGSVDSGDTVKQAYLLNRPMHMTAISAQNGNMPVNASFIFCEEDNIILETLKKSEADDGMILRLYDAGNRAGKAHLHFNLPVHSVALCDMMESEQETLPMENQSVVVPVGNFEIITLKLKK